MLMMLSMVLLWGCKPSEDAKYVSLGEVKYIKDFPYDEELKEIPVNVDEIGLFGVRVVGDSLLILGHGNNWSIHSIDGKRNYGRCLSTGQGPDEFVDLPYIGTVAFETILDSLWAYIPDQFNQRIVAFNISKFLSSGNQEMYSKKNFFLENLKWSIMLCDADEFMMLEPYDDFHGLRRMIASDDSIKELLSTQSLSKNTVDKGLADLNLLSTVIRYSPEEKMFTEAMVYLNQINVYSLDNHFAVTICVGDNLDNLSNAENTISPNRTFAYKSATSHKLGFGAIFSGHTLNPLESQNTEIQFFNWALEPVYRFKQSFEASALDLDITHKRLWIVDKDEDVLRCYDATPIIKAYEKNTRS